MLNDTNFMWNTFKFVDEVGGRNHEKVALY